MEPQAPLARRPSATTVNISPAYQDDPIDYSHSSARSSASPHLISLQDSGRIGTNAFSQGQHIRKESFPSPLLDRPGALRRSVPALFGNSNISNGAGSRGSTSSGPRTPHVNVNANGLPSYGGARRAFYTTKSQPGWKRTLRLVRDVILRPIYLVGRRGPLIPLLLVLICFGLFLTYSTSPSSQKVKLKMQGAVGPYIPQRAASAISWRNRASEEAESGAGLDDEESDYTPPGSKKPTEATKARQGKLPKAKSTLSTAVELPPARRDGRLLLKEGEVHPIPAMMARAKRQWKELKGRQSKTFKEAVAEYEKRYQRKPPKGFDQWYAFAKAHKVVLIDEFDLIDKDLLMYRAFDPPHFRNRVKYTSTYLDMLWNMSVTNGVISRAGQLENHDRARGVEFLASRFAHLLPDMTIMYNGHDGARIAVAAEERARLENLVKKGECEPLTPVSAGCTANTSVLTTKGRVTALTDEPDEGAPYPPKETGPWPHHSMPAFCPNGTAVRGKDFEYGWASMDSTGYEMPAPVPGSIGSLVDGFKQYIDVCDSPQYRHFHATTSWVYPHHPTPVVPLFTPGVQTTFGDVHSLIVEQLELEAKHDPKWEERPFSSLQWRGQTSGPLWEKTSPWRTTQRARLHLLSHQESGTRNITLTDEDDKMRLVEVPNFKLNPLFLDIGMVGPAVQCVKEDGTCDEMQEVFQGYDKRISFDRAALYKYVLDVDGNSWSGRFRRLMLSNAAVVKATIFPEFWTDWAIPWLHFIPMQVDYSDMWDILAFFRGGINGEGAHDALGKQIAMAGKEWVRSCYRWADLETYQFRLMLEYGRLYNDETEPGSKDFNGDTSIEPVWKGEVKLE